GIWRLESSGNWTNLNGNLAITQLNGVASDPTSTNSILGGSQANGADTFTNALPWTRVDGYGGGQVAIHPNNPQNVYAIGLQLGANAIVRKSTNGGASWTTVLSILGQTAPLVLDSVNTSRLLVGGSSLQESLDGGNTWTTLLPSTSVTAIGVA